MSKPRQKAFQRARASALSYLDSLSHPSRATPGTDRLVGIDGMGGLHTLIRQGDGMWGGTMRAVDQVTGEVVMMPFAVPDVTAQRWAETYRAHRHQQVAS